MINKLATSDGGTPIQVTKISLDDVEVAIHHNESRGVPDTVSWWHFDM